MKELLTIIIGIILFGLAIQVCLNGTPIAFIIVGLLCSVFIWWVIEKIKPVKE